MRWYWRFSCGYRFRARGFGWGSCFSCVLFLVFLLFVVWWLVCVWFSYIRLVFGLVLLMGGWVSDGGGALLSVSRAKSMYGLWYRCMNRGVGSV